MTKSTFPRWWLALAVASAMALSAGCGQKGDLYIPSKAESRQDLRAG